ncbi:MAG: hypothetical protein V4724_01785 [Pseudomonadota bacterium]
MELIKEGDVVRLKCGGPTMDVLAVLPAYPFQSGIATAVYCIPSNAQFRFEQILPLYALDIVRYEQRRFIR